MPCPDQDLAPDLAELIETALDLGDYDNAAQLLADCDSVSKSALHISEPDRIRLAAALAPKGLEIFDDGNFWIFISPEPA